MLLAGVLRGGVVNAQAVGDDADPMAVKVNSFRRGKSEGIVVSPWTEDHIPPEHAEREYIRHSYGAITML
jgi:hypothetical protein